jgi:2-hydroxychromene-2-carboxylate isomerase
VHGSSAGMPELTFYFDLGSPYAYLAAERLESMIPAPVRWQPVLLGGLFKLTGRSSWARADHDRRRRGMADIEQRALSYGLPPMRWPDPWPTNYLFAMRAATYAFTVGPGRAFVMQAYRNAFQRGVDLSNPARVLEAGREVGLEPDEVEAGTSDDAIKDVLRDATEAAYEHGVIGVPTVAVDDVLFWGDDRLEDAAAFVGGGR